MTEASGMASRGVSSNTELLAIAHAMEKEAARRYHDLAARMRRRGDASLAALFTFLEGIESKHASRIDAQSLHRTGRPTEPMQVRWDVPENFDEEEASSRLLTPYLALAIAVRNEDRAFAFFSYVAAEAVGDDIRVLAEELAKEELTHAALLRRERRKAYRDRPRIAETPGRGNLPATVGELLRHATELESTAAAHHRALADELVQRDRRRAGAFAAAAADEMQLATTLSERLGMTPPEPRVLTPPTSEDGLRILEEAFNFYSDVAERSKDEAVVSEAQALAERAVRRLALAHGEVRAAATGNW